jgi:geranylgeranyl diphosphate synthase type I
MSLPAILEKYREDIDREVKAVIDSRPAPLYDMMRYHFGWADKKGNPVQSSSGKALRPSLCLFSCEAVGGDYRKALPAAAALELIHNFSLIHDDIQDNDRERRHRATVWTIWGKAQAINAGTAMRILANSALWRLRGDGVSWQKQAYLGERLDEISLKLIEGQYLDIAYEDRFDISVEDYLTMISGKTAALISGSMEVGAFLGGDRALWVEGFSEVGRNLGLAFQIRDDILGIWGDEKDTGKSAGNDIRRRKKSFPVVYALEHVGGQTREELVEFYARKLMDEPTVARVLEIFDSVGTRVYAQKLVRKYCAQAGRTFNGLGLAPQVEGELAGLIHFLTGRNY